MSDITYCDNCGEPEWGRNMYHFQSSPFATASTNKYESASICKPCFIFFYTMAKDSHGI